MSRPSLGERLDALRSLRELGSDALPASTLAAIDSLLVRADGRRALSAEHTVVGLFGATGSGKSSLLNALVRAPVARSHVRRPTTSEPLSVSWDPAGAAPLLDWLDVRDRHEGELALDQRAKKLILLDLPDFDSVESAHRTTAERLASQVDALVWVVDPQKYADAVLHTEFIAAHSRHGAVTIVVLNRADLLPAGDVPKVVASLKKLLADDGLNGVPVLPTSALTGEGVGPLRTAIGDLAGAAATQAERLGADVAALADSISSPGVSPKPGKSDAKARSSALTKQLGAAAGVDTVVRAVAGSYRKRSGQATGWPVVSWVLHFRADPLARLGLRQTRSGGDSNADVHRTSMPTLNAAASARVSLAVRDYGEAVSSGLAEQWRAGVRRSAQHAIDGLPPALDLAISRTTLPTRRSWWWVPFGILQWLAIAAALVGVFWMLALAFLPNLGLTVPQVEGWPVTTLLVAGGLLLGILLGLAGAALGAITASSRARVARRALTTQVGAVAERLVIDPIAANLARVQRFDAALAIAGGATRPGR